MCVHVYVCMYVCVCVYVCVYVYVGLHYMYMYVKVKFLEIISVDDPSSCFRHVV